MVIFRENILGAKIVNNSVLLVAEQAQSSYAIEKSVKKRKKKEHKFRLNLNCKFPTLQVMDLYSKTYF